MKYIFTLFLACTLLPARSQRFEAGLLSGMGFSDYHGKTSTGKWDTKSGTVTGVFFRYKLSPVLSIGTELNYTEQQYYYKPYKNPGYPYPYPYPWYLSSSSLFFIPVWERMEFSFYRVPLYLTLSTPTRLQLSVSAGIFLSFTADHEYTGQSFPGYPYYPSYYSYYPYYPESDPPRHDNGYLFATSISYPVSDDFRLYVMGRYFIGKRKFIMDQGMTGASELAFGVSYTGLFKQENDRLRNDSALSRLSITPSIGFAVSRIRKPGHPESYSPRTALAPGIRLEYKLGSSFSLISGLSFERKGYHMNDSSYFYYRHALASWTTYQVNTTTDLDYAVIPLMLKIGTGTRTRVYVTGGAYLGIKLNARVTGTAGYETSSLYGYNRNRIDVYDDIQGIVKNTDWGWITGAGVEVPLTNGKKLDLGVQYASGKENILENDGDYGTSLSESDDLIRNGSLQIYIGLSIPIHKSN
jgi:hypothetical protein